MTDTTNPGDGEAMSEVVDAFDSDDAILNPSEDNQDQDEAEDDGDQGDEDQPEDDSEEVEFEGETFTVPKKIRDGLLRQADYTRKTQEVAEERKAVVAQREIVQRTAVQQQEFVADIAQLGALNDRLEPYKAVTDWPTYLRTGGAEAQAHYAEFNALQQQRESHARTLQGKIQQRDAEEQRETAKQIEAGRAEIAKHIKGYTPETLNKLAEFGATYGFSREEILQAEADPRSIRALHEASLWRNHVAQQKRTSTLAQAQKTKPVQTLRGAGGRIAARPDSNDFKAVERMALEKLGVT